VSGAITLPRLPVLAFMEPRGARGPALSPLDPQDWLTDWPDHVAQVAYRQQLITERRGDVIACLPEGHAAADELCRMVLGGAREGDPLEAVGRWASEDFCLLQKPAEGGEYRLVAGVLCFPSHWSLTEKLGQPLTAIHGPVPGYANDLARRVNRVFEALRVEQPLIRWNWLLQSEAELHMPPGHERRADGPFYLRAERQTFRRMPETEAVAFGIRTAVMPISGLSGAEARALMAAMDAQPGAMVAYKGGAAFYAAGRAALAAQAE